MIYNRFIIFFCVVFVGLMFAKAQVGIGTTSPDASTILDVYSPNKGMLIPRVQLSAINDVSTVPVVSSATSPDQGILVYNLANAGTAPNNVIKDTFYIWTGTQWEAIGEVTDTRTEINARNITKIIFSGSPASSTAPYTASSYSNWTEINFSTESIDTQNVHNAGTFTISETGLYSFSGNVRVNISQTGGTRKTFGAQIKDLTTGLIIATTYFGTGGGGSNGDMPLNWMGNLTAGTQLQIQYRMRDTTNSNVTLNAKSTNITLRKHFN